MGLAESTVDRWVLPESLRGSRLQDLTLYQLVDDGRLFTLEPRSTLVPFLKSIIRVRGTFCHFNFIYNCVDLYLVYTTKFILKSKTGFEFGHSKL